MMIKVIKRLNENETSIIRLKGEPENFKGAYESLILGFGHLFPLGLLEKPTIKVYTEEFWMKNGKREWIFQGN